MSSLYNRINKLCVEKMVRITDMCRQSGANRSSLSDLKTGRKKSLSTNTMMKIVDYFSVSSEYLLGFSTIHTCPGCGLEYDESDKQQASRHSEQHMKWVDAVKKYGFCWNFKEREKKHECRYYMENRSNPFAKRYESAIEMIKSYFSRSLDRYDFKLDHPLLEEYIALFIHSQKKTLPDDIFKSLKNEYGEQEGMAGTDYGNGIANPDPENQSKKEVLTTEDGSEQLIVDNETLKFIEEFRNLSPDAKKYLIDLSKLLNEKRLEGDAKS